VTIAPFQHEDIDVGDALPARCLRQGLWLSRSAGTSFALLLSPASRYGQAKGLHVEVAGCPGEAGSKLSRRVLDKVEALVKQTKSYRGKVIWLEATDRFSGQSGEIKVHKLQRSP
jgi:hypothetical protein